MKGSTSHLVLVFTMMDFNKRRECNSDFQGLGGGGDGELLFNGIKFQLCRKDTFWRSAVQHESIHMGFPDRSADKESAYNAGDPGSISELGSSPGERISYPFQYSWASLVDQTIKNLTAMQETWGQSLNWGFFSLGKEMATNSSILAGEFHGQRRLVGYSPWGHKEFDVTERLSTAPQNLSRG